MKTISENIFSIPEPATAAGYVSLARDFEKKFREGTWMPAKTLKIALLSSFSLNGLKEILTAKGGLSGIGLQVYEGPYNQWGQEILDPSSGLYAFAPELVILFADTASLLGEKYFRPYAPSSGNWQEWTDRQFEEFKGLVLFLQKRSNAKILLHNFEVPAYSPLGILEAKQEFGWVEAVETLNQKLRQTFKKDSQVYLLDYNAFLSRIGKQGAVDPKMLYLADMKLDLQKMPALAGEYMGMIRPLAGLSKKCLVLDLDNTLWGGVAGEDGIDGIRLGPDPEGRPFWEFQKRLAALHDRGVVLALNSRNNPEDALTILRNHPHMILKEDFFAAVRINWEDKAENLKSIAEELNLGIESFVFLDDDPANRARMRQAFPEVRVEDLPEDPALYTRMLMNLDAFQSLQLTDEDFQKGKMYAQEKKRRAVEQTAGDLTSYLRALEMEVTLENGGEKSVPRIAQLTQKTNQFNMMTRRYQEEDILGFVRDPASWVFLAAVRDQYGENGITAAVIVKKNGKAWEIDTFLMSCRIIGRRVEEVLMAHLLAEARKAGAEAVLGKFIPTEKNAPANGFYARCGFECVEKKDGAEIWRRALEKPFTAPDFISVKIKEQA